MNPNYDRKNKQITCHKSVTTGRKVGGQITERKRRFPAYPSQPPDPTHKRKTLLQEERGYKISLKDNNKLAQKKKQ